MLMQSGNLNMNARYMTRRMHCINLNLSCQVWTLGKLLHDEPFYMPWAKQGTTGSCKTHVHHYLDKVRQAPSMYIWNASIWQGNYMTLETSSTLSSLHNLQKVLSSRGFVKISANWSSKRIPQSSISFLATWSLRKWWWISMCLVRECWTGLLAILTTLSLSQRSGILSNTTP